MTIKTKLLGAMAISVFSILVNTFIVNHMLNESKNLEQSKVYIHELESDMQYLMKSSKEFLEYKKPKYEIAFQKRYELLNKHIEEFKDNLENIDLETQTIDEISKNIALYKNSFQEIVSIQKKLGYSDKDGLTKQLYDAIKNAEINAKKLQNQDIFSMVLTLRNIEKSFMITHNKKFLKKFKRTYNALIYFIDENIQDKESIKNNLANYKKYFTAYVKATEKKGLTSNDGLLGNMNKIIAKNEKLLSNMLIEYTPILEKKISSLQKYSLMIQLALGTIVVVLLFFVISSIVAPINQLINAAKNLTHGDGDLTVRLKTNSNDEISQANHYINHFIEKVQTVLKGIIDSSSENSTISDNLAKTVQEVEQRSEKENIELQKVVHESQTIRKDLNNAIKEAQAGKNNLLRSNENLEETKKDILLLVKKVQDSSQMQLELADSLSKLSDDTAQVKEVLSVISDIADQTNLLALNAAIEAARAGEHGRGFAVVADEVRKLAEKTQKSLTEINATVNVIIQAIIDSSNNMNKNSKEIEELAAISSEVGAKINETVEIMTESSKMSENILNGYHENAKKTDFIIDKIYQVSNLSNENAASIDNVAKSSTHLNKMTEELNHRLKEFKV